MTFIDQVIIDKGIGDCQRAAVASILGLESIEQVPHFILYKEGMWFVVYKSFMRIFGHEWEGVSNNPEDLKKENSINGLFLASVTSKTFGLPTKHAVVIDMNGKVVHDPNPNKLWQDEIVDFNDPNNTFDLFKW